MIVLVVEMIEGVVEVRIRKPINLLTGTTLVMADLTDVAQKFGHDGCHRHAGCRDNVWLTVRRRVPRR